MSDPFLERPPPRATLYGALAVVGLSLALVSASRLGLPELAGGPDRALEGSAAPAPAQAGEVLGRTELYFQDRPDGAVLVSARTGAEPVLALAPGEGGFVRGVLRSLARERRQHQTDPGHPFWLQRHAGGGLSLYDPQTGRLIVLQSFGPTNLAAFARIADALAVDARVKAPAPGAAAVTAQAATGGSSPGGKP